MDADTKIFQDLLAKFQSGSPDHRAQLSVDVRDGVVIISGRVNTLAERKAVERTAKRVNGIRTLILEIGAAALPLLATESFVVSRRDSTSVRSG
jgi:osmotically-inducible protein OsmY